jgi:hypothetical protein
VEITPEEIKLVFMRQHATTISKYIESMSMSIGPLQVIVGHELTVVDSGLLSFFSEVIQS